MLTRATQTRVGGTRFGLKAQGGDNHTHGHHTYAHTAARDKIRGALALGVYVQAPTRVQPSSWSVWHRQQKEAQVALSPNGGHLVVFRGRS